MQNAQNTVQNNPFAQPVAPVAGFSGLQQQGFNQLGQSANLANPFYNQAAGLYGQAAQQPDVSAFYNPMAGAVGAQLSNIFGQQNSQNTGQLTQAAGGVGADRIAVGQANLANQQGLAAGQTFAGLYGQAQQAAQQQQQAQMQAAAGLGNVGQGLQNAALSGGNALLGAGGLQQQLAQAQLNAPYQQQLAQQAFPYQQASWLSGQVGALAPGLGGTTTGQGQTTSQFNPSLWGQIGGGLQSLAGIGGYLGGSGGGGGGGMFSSLFGGSPSAAGTPGSPYYGPVYSGMALGGSVNPFASGGAVSDEPIDIAPESMFPTGQLPHIQAHIPTLNLNPPQQSQGGGGGGGGGAGLASAIKLASMFMNSGGAVYPNPYAEGGAVSDETRAQGLDMLRDAMNGADSINPGNPYQMTDPAAVDDWRRSTPLPSTADANNSVPMPQPRPAAADDEAPEDVTATSKLPPVASPSLAPQGVQADTGPSLAGFLKSPWSALTLGGLEAMRTGSLASGFGQTLKLAGEQREASQKDETVKQAAQRLMQEAEQHNQDFGLKSQALELKRQEQEGTASDKADAVKAIADAIESGEQPPSTSQLYGKAAAVKAELAKRHFNLQQAQLQDSAARKQVASLNAPQMQKFIGLTNSVTNTIDEVKALGEQLHNGGIPLLNKVKLAALVQTEANSPRGTLAQRYLTAINTLKSEFANLEAGGFAPHESVWKLANDQMSSDFGEKQLNAALDEIQRLVKYRLNAIPNVNTFGPGAANRYTGQTGQAPAAAAPSFTGRTASGPGGAKLRETSTGEWVP